HSVKPTSAEAKEYCSGGKPISIFHMGLKLPHQFNCIGTPVHVTQSIVDNMPALLKQRPIRIIKGVKKFSPPNIGTTCGRSFRTYNDTFPTVQIKVHLLITIPERSLLLMRV